MGKRITQSSELVGRGLYNRKQLGTIFIFPGKLGATWIILLFAAFIVAASVASTQAVIALSEDNSRPIADAGPDQTVGTGVTVTLDGSRSSDADGDFLEFSWLLAYSPDGSGVIPSDPAVARPTFEIDLPGDYVFELIVSDGLEDSFPAKVTISTDNSIPVADAGSDQSVTAGDLVVLDGSL